VLGVATRGLLRIDEVAIDLDLEYSSGGGNENELIDAVLEALQ
jgi:hypothetical protein